VATAGSVAAGPEDARYIVAFQVGRGGAGRAALHAAGAGVVLELGPQNAVAAHIPARALPGLERNPNIEYIEQDAIRTPSALWSDVSGGGETIPYGIQMVQADQVSGANAGNRKVCVIDSGYSQQHEDLKDASGGEVTANANDSGSGTWDIDSCGHGTHVAGTVAATANNGVGVVGVAPGVRLHIVKVFGNDVPGGGNCSWTYSSTLVNALNKCVAAGANVVSMSLGGGFKSRTEENAFNAAYQQGVLSIAAAGNAGNKTTSYPAGYASVVSVAAVDADENVAAFSQKNRDVELAAPGVAVLSSVPWLDTNTLGSGATTVSGGHVENSARTPGHSSFIVDGGQCTSASAQPLGAIVLCQRGTNSFFEKVTNVQNGGGGAAVIYNNAANDPSCGDFAGTLGDGNSSAIPAISVSCADGATMLGFVNSGGTLVSQLAAPASSYEAWDGTSMATPHVSGVAALVWSQCPGSTNAQLRSALDNSARDKGAAGRDTSYGFGIVQALAALDYMQAQDTCIVP
jgi:subtilisin family serine protease